jgi:PAS domain S-box-containing protein
MANATPSPLDYGIGSLFWKIPEAVIVAETATGKIVLWNPAAERMFGYPAAEVMGHDVQVIVPPAYRDAHRHGMARFHATGHGPLVDGHRPVELPALHRDGSVFTIELSLSPTTGPGGVTYAMALVRDISARKAAEAELRQAYDELKAADRYKDEFLSVISHELRTPLNFIIGFASVMYDGVDGPLTQGQHDHLGKILEGSDRMLALVDDLLDFAKLQAGKFQVDCRPTAYAPLVHNVISSLAPLAEAKQIRLVKDVQANVKLEIDGQRIVQVLMNLLSNAIKFTPAEGQIVVRAYVEGGALVTEVKDTGLGIVPADLPRVFEKFKQVDMSATRQAGGTGLGLSIAKALVEAHGGTIGAISDPGHGSTFWYRLPLAQG